MASQSCAATLDQLETSDERNIMLCAYVVGMYSNKCVKKVATRNLEHEYRLVG